MGDRSGAGRWARCAPVAGLLALLALAAAGCGSGGPASAAAHPDRFAKARALFREICAGCHTLADAGAHGNRLRLDRAWNQPQLLAHNARTTIEEGDAGMPEWRGTLTRREIDLLARYVGTVANAPPSSSGDGRLARTLTPRPHPWRARPVAQRFADGRALFKELCVGCHTLRDAGAHGERVDLDAALAPIPAADRAAVVSDALEHSDAMPDWKWRLGPTQFDSLVRYVSTVAGRGR